jgi:hypothetical protein
LHFPALFRQGALQLLHPPLLFAVPGLLVKGLQPPFVEPELPLASLELLLANSEPNSEAAPFAQQDQQPLRIVA